MLRSEITTTKVLTPADRAAAMEVVDAVYRHEKRWIADSDSEIPTNLPERADVSWFVTHVDGVPAGVIRLAYDPPLSIPPELDFHFERDIALDRLPPELRFVDIGRFMILPRFRRRIRVVTNLMRGAVEEVVGRGYTHFITDVFESDPHSPLHFHTRVLGFERIGTHRFGELNCESVRIILVLDLARTYRRLLGRRDRIYRELIAGLNDRFESLPLAPAL